MSSGFFAFLGPVNDRNADKAAVRCGALVDEIQFDFSELPFRLVTNCTTSLSDPGKRDLCRAPFHGIYLNHESGSPKELALFWWRKLKQTSIPES